MANAQAATNKATNSVVNAGSNSPVTEKATAAAHHAVDAVSLRAASAEDTIRKTAASSGEALHEKQEQIKHQLQGSYQRTRAMAVENPLAAAGIAFAAGVLVTALFRRGS